jgi:hypothetical protein
MLCAFVNCATVLTKGLNFFFFQLPKAEPRPLHTFQLRRGRVFEAYIGAFKIVNCRMKKKDLIQVRNEYSPQASKLLHNCQLKIKEAL